MQFVPDRDNLILDRFSHGDCDFSSRSVKVSILFTPPRCLSSSVGLMPGASQPHSKLPSFCLSTSPSLPLPIPQLCPAGVRKLMALSRVLTINQASISQAHITLWTNAYTGMRGLVRTKPVRMERQDRVRGKLQSREGTR